MRATGSMPLTLCDDRDAGAMVLLFALVLAVPGSAVEAVLEAMVQPATELVMGRPVMPAMQAHGELIVVTADPEMQPVTAMGHVRSVAEAAKEMMPLDRMAALRVMPVMVT